MLLIHFGVDGRIRPTLLRDEYLHCNLSWRTNVDSCRISMEDKKNKVNKQYKIAPHKQPILMQVARGMYISNLDSILEQCFTLELLSYFQPNQNIFGCVFFNQPWLLGVCACSV